VPFAASFAEAFVDGLYDLYGRMGERRYGEDVTQLEHALQCASHAARDGAPDSLVAAALLHDVGHMLQKAGEDAADHGLDARHEKIGAGLLARAFGPDVTQPVRLHVAAKRYLAAREPGYLEGLSRASLQSLQLQGGPMGADEIGAFLAEPWAEAAIRLRRYDEMGKDLGAAPPGLAAYRAMLERLVEAADQGQ
jgi:phosphonate degradation associated HDIG domain protein